jgi:hypothetical protein
MDFELAFTDILLVIAKLFLLMGIGYVLRLKKLVDDDFIDTLSLLIVRVVFPALIISRTIRNFSFTEYANWWFFPVSALIFIFLGLAVSSLLYKALELRQSPREFRCACAFQNCGYLPLNMILFSFTGAVAERFFIYIFLYILGFNILMWSLVPLYLEGRLRSNFRMKVFLNPPVVATAVSLLWVALLGKGTLPGVISEPLTQLGNSSFPLVMLTLGAYLCRYRAFRPERAKDLFTGVAVRLLIIPAIVLVFLYFTGLSPDKKFFLFLQSMMPTAVSLVVIGAYSGADNRFMSGMIFYTHMIALVTVPVWLGIFSHVID